MSEILKDVINVIKKVGEEVLKIYNRDYLTSEKKDKSPITEADLVSEKIILEGLRKYNYNFGVLSEESKDSDERLNRKRIWIIDPLDGTLDFIKKTGEFSVMIGLVEEGEPVIGVVCQPTEDKIYFAQKGKGAFLQQGKNFFKKLRVSNISEISEVRLVISRFHLEPQEIKFIKKLNLKNTQKMGSCGLKVAKIAEGKADLYFNMSSKTHQWDSCAPQIILKEAGGKITDLRGKELIYNRKETKNLNGLLATNGLIHQKIIKILAGSFE